jgi:hypothetical protein
VNEIDNAMPKEGKEHKEHKEKREHGETKRKLEKEAKEKIKGTRQERLDEKKEHVFHQTNKKEVERENKRKAKEKLEKNTVKLEPSKFMFHGLGARLQVSLQNHGHIPRQWFSREKLAKTFHRSRIVDVRIDHVPDNSNSILVPQVEARKITVGQGIKDAVKETVNSGNEVGFLYDAALLDTHVRSPIVEGTEGKISGAALDALIEPATHMRQAGRLGLFHTHPLEPKRFRWIREAPAYAQTASQNDYLALGGSNDLSVAIPHPEEKTPDGKPVAPTYTFIRTRGVDNNQDLKDEVRSIVMPGKTLMDPLDKPHLKRLYGFFHKLGGRYERVKVNRVPKLIKEKNEPRVYHP